MARWLERVLRLAISPIDCLGAHHILLGYFEVYNSLPRCCGPTLPPRKLMSAGQPAHDGGLLLAYRLGDWVDVYVEHRRLGLPFELQGKNHQGSQQGV